MSKADGDGVRVSVVIPAFNAVGCIGRAIASVRAQSEADFEILVVDDASTDATPAVVGALAQDDSRIRLLRAPANGGPGLARNQAIEAARGAWIALLDADDAYLPKRLATLAELGERLGADMVADNLQLCTGAPPRPGATMFAAAQLPERLDAAGFVRGNMYRGGAGRLSLGYLKPLLRRSFLAGSGPTDVLRYDAARFSEDYLFYLRCLLGGARWVLTPEPMYLYTVDPHSLTAAHSAQDLRHLAAAEQALLPRAAGDPALQAGMRRHIRAVRRALAWFGFATALKRRDVRGAWASLDGDPGNVLHIGREAVRAVPRAWARIAR